MTPVSIVITFKGRQLQRQIRCRPEDRLIQALAADSPDQSLDEWMRQRNVRNRFDFCHVQDSQVCLPLMKPVKRIVIRTELPRETRTPYRFLKHPTKRHPIHDSTLDSESDDPPRVLVHHDQYPVRPQRYRFTSEQVNAVKAVFRVTNEGEPGRSITVRRRMVMRGENTTHDILINTNAEGQIDLLGNARTSPCRITLLHIDHCTN